MTATLDVRPATTVASSPPISPPAIRVVPAPRSEPLSDDERSAAGLDNPVMSAPVLPLELPGAMRKSRTRPALVRLSGAAGPDGGEPAPGGDPDGPPPLPSPARPATRLFLATCVEVIGGFRPMAQLRPLCFAEQFPIIADRLASHPATSPASRTRALAYLAGRTPVTGRNTGAPPRTARSNQTSPGERTSVRRVQICDIGSDVAEVAVVLGRREQAWAMALRFEQHRGTWLCSLLEVI